MSAVDACRHPIPRGARHGNERWEAPSLQTVESWAHLGSVSKTGTCPTQRCLPSHFTRWQPKGTRRAKKSVRRRTRRRIPLRVPARAQEQPEGACRAFVSHRRPYTLGRSLLQPGSRGVTACCHGRSGGILGRCWYGNPRPGEHGCRVNSGRGFVHSRQVVARLTGGPFGGCLTLALLCRRTQVPF